MNLILNEVLSLNAQELGCLTRVVAFALLNEVLSLNAQEYRRHILNVTPFAFLNEVLSLNAQEWCEP